ncbi:MAG TPA: hypothetical protein VFP50_09440 [Anaeromyxobacteraceae bacterium]|nr:hypothetical protein [Anaeromyxobacteraceae bacterium]
MKAATRLATYLSRTRTTQTAFAEQIGVSCALVSMWLAGTRRPGGWSAIAIEQKTGGAVPVTAWTSSKRRGPRAA